MGLAAHKSNCGILSHCHQVVDALKLVTNVCDQKGTTLVTWVVNPGFVSLNQKLFSTKVNATSVRRSPINSTVYVELVSKGKKAFEYVNWPPLYD